MYFVFFIVSPALSAELDEDSIIYYFVKYWHLTISSHFKRIQCPE